ncbi:MAG: PfkB family carbohydrate kinase [Variovorax sp.]
MTKVFVIGNATVDVIQHVERFPFAGETLLCEALTICAGGKGLNQAIAAARTGARTVLRSPLATDGNGDLLKRTAASETDLAADWLIVEPPTDVSSIWIAATGENMIVSSADAAAFMTPAHIAATCSEIVPDDLLLLQGNLSEATTAAAIALARKKGARVLLNTAPMQAWMRPLLADVDLLIANEIEARELSEGADDAAAALLRTGARVVVISRGRHGALLATRAGQYAMQPPVVQAIDTAGAGDVLTGTLAGLLAQGSEVHEALPLAIAAASLSVTRAGTTPSFPSRAEFAELKARPYIHADPKETVRA